MYGLLTGSESFNSRPAVFTMWHSLHGIAHHQESRNKHVARTHAHMFIQTKTEQLNWRCQHGLYGCALSATPAGGCTLDPFTMKSARHWRKKFETFPCTTVQHAHAQLHPATPNHTQPHRQGEVGLGRARPGEVGRLQSI